MCILYDVCQDLQILYTGFTIYNSTHREADVGGRPLAAPHPVVGGAGVHPVMIPGHTT